MMSLSPSGGLLLGFQIFFMVLALVAVALRVIAKRIRDRPLQSHDICCFLCLIFMYAYSIIYCIAPFHGIGHHAATLDPDQLATVFKLFFASEYMYNTCVLFMRMSILLLYMSIFQNRRFRLVSYGLGAFIILFSVCSMLYLFGFCQPMSKMWHPLEPGTCGNTFTVEIVSGAVNLVLDLILIALPMPFIWRLQMPVQRKVAVSSVFCLGLLNVGINVGRIVQPIVTDFDDFTYSTPGASILVIAELLTGLLVSCVPTIGPIFKPEQYRNKYQIWHDTRSNKRQHGSHLLDSGHSREFGSRSFAHPNRSSPSASETQLGRLQSVDESSRAHGEAASKLARPGAYETAKREGDVRVQVELHVFESQRPGASHR